MHECNIDLDIASVHLDAEQYDEDDFYINTTSDTSFYIPAPTDEQMEEHDLYMIPEPHSLRCELRPEVLEPPYLLTTSPFRWLFGGIG